MPPHPVANDRLLLQAIRQPIRQTQEQPQSHVVMPLHPVAIDRLLLQAIRLPIRQTPGQQQ